MLAKPRPPLAALALTAVLTSHLSLGPSQAGQSGSSAPLAAATSEPGPLENSIRALYRANQDAATRSGTPILLDLSDFALLEPHQFQKTPWALVYSHSLPFRFEYQPFRLEASDDTLIGEAYPLLLLRSEPPPHPEGDSLSLEAALSLARTRGEIPGARLTAASTYKVSLAFQNETFSYRALALWYRLPSDSHGGTVHVLDPAVPVLERLRDQRLTLLPENLLFLKLGEHEERLHSQLATSSASVKTACVADIKNYDYPQTTKISDIRHYSGNHQSTVTFHGRCSCDSTCTSMAVMSITGTSCRDWGAVWGVGTGHFPRVQMDTRDEVVINAVNSAAEGSAAYVCVIQECLFAGCNWGINIDLRLTSFTFTGSNVVQDMSSFNTTYCNPCTEAQALPSRARSDRGPFNIDPESGQGGGGGIYQGPSSGSCSICIPSWVQSAYLCQPSPAPCWIETCHVTC